MKRASSFSIEKYNKSQPKRRKLCASSASFHISKELTDEQSELFIGVKALIVSNGIGPVRYGILKNQLKQRGGKIQHRLHSSTTHIVTTLQLEKLQSILKIKNIPTTIKVVAPEWISESLRRRSTLNSTNFSVKQEEDIFPVPELPKVKKEEDNKIEDNKTTKSSPISPVAPSPNTPLSPTWADISPSLNTFSFKVNTTPISPIPISPISKSKKTSKAFPWLSPIEGADDDDDDEKENLDSTNDISFTLEYKTDETDLSDLEIDLSDTESCTEDGFDFSSSSNEGEDDEWLSYLPSSSPKTPTKKNDLTNVNKSGKRSGYWMNKKYLACQKSVSPKINSPTKNTVEIPKAFNIKIINILKEMENLEKNLGEQWRSLAYRKAITALERIPYEIKTKEEARKIRGVGEKISKKIEEIIETGTLKRLNNTDDRTQAFNIFSQVWGAGPESIKKWLAQGYYTLEDLRANQSSLNKQQQIGVRYYNVSNPYESKS